MVVVRNLHHRKAVENSPWEESEEASSSVEQCLLTHLKEVALHLVEERNPRFEE